MSSVLKPVLGSQLQLGHRLAQSLVGLWLFNEGSGNKVLDLSGNGYDMTLVHSPLWKAGKFGSALELDGVNDYGSVGSALLDRIKATNAFTLVAWVYNTDLTKDSCIVGQWGTNNQFQLWMDTGGAGDGYVCIVQGAATTTVTSVNSINAIANIWQQVVVTWDGITLSIYIDGVFDNSVIGAQAIRASTELLGIGSSEGDTIDRAWPGMIDHILIYDNAKSASEIALLHQEPFCMFKDPAEVALLGSYQAVVGMAGAMTTNTGYWGW